MTSLTQLTIVAGLAAAIAPITAHANELNLSSLDEATHRVHVKTGAEYAFVAGLGYSRVVPFLDRKLVLSGEATVPWAHFDLGDWSLRAGALVPVVGTQRWRLAASLSPIARGNKSSLTRMTDLGVDAAMIGGFYSKHFFAAAEFGLDAALTTHVAHTDEYRMSVHTDAKDGWYANPGANVRAGIQAGASFDRYDVILRAGQVRDTEGEPPLVPFYATLSANARW